MRLLSAAFIVVSLAAAAQAAVPASQKPMEVCKQFADITQQVFTKRDQGVTAHTQLQEWHKITATDPERDKLMPQIGGVIDYAYSETGRTRTPKAARTEFFRGCRATILPVPR